MDMTEVAQIAKEALDSAKSAHHRIGGLSEEIKDVRSLTDAVATVSQQVGDLRTDMSEVKADVKEITKRPGKWWDILIGAVIGAIGAGVATAILAAIFK